MLFKNDKCDCAILSLPQLRMTLHGKCMDCPLVLKTTPQAQGTSLLSVRLCLFFSPLPTLKSNKVQCLKNVQRKRNISDKGIFRTLLSHV